MTQRDPNGRRPYIPPPGEEWLEFTRDEPRGPLPTHDERGSPIRDERGIPLREERAIPIREERAIPIREERVAPAREDRPPLPRDDRQRPVLELPPPGEPRPPQNLSATGMQPVEKSGPELTQTTIQSLQNLHESNPAPRKLLEAWLGVMVKVGASDLILRAGGRPSTRIDGRIGFLPGRVPSAGAMLEVLEGVLGEHRMNDWRRTGSADASLHLDGLGRFRLNAYKQIGEPALVVRRISDQAPNLDDLEMPSNELRRIAMRKRGLMMVTGVAGSGKSTTLSAMIQHMNVSAERHVITLEDPVELLFSEKRCVISQREVGTDCTDFHDGLRHALRQSPDVILIGEMRDAETVTAALDAAETGHLVLSTMHTVNAAQTVDRILGFFPAERHGQLRMRLSDNLACVLSQRLLQRIGGRGMVPAYELLVSTPRIRELLEEGDTLGVARVIEQGGSPGLISFNQSLRRLVQSRIIELKDALSASDRPEELVLALKGISAGTDEKRFRGMSS